MTLEQRIEHIATISAILLAQIKEIQALREQVHQALPVARQLNIQESGTNSKD
jgi:hypothetical protein